MAHPRDRRIEKGDDVRREEEKHGHYRRHLENVAEAPGL
jgi:hypothetical protein